MPSEPDTEQHLLQMLGEVSAHIRLPQDPSLFSIGARGYYENPTSDLLAFFLSPDKPHGLGSIFLDAFLRCLPDDSAIVTSRKHVRVAREGETRNGKKVDLVIRGMGWMILIENKIHHHQNNPFDDYEEHFTTENGGKQPLMVVLSPQGTSIAGNWKPVSYRAFCRELKTGLQPLAGDSPSSKWRIFAEEFVLHLHNELYHTAMEQKTIEFVEGNWVEIARAKKLFEEYRLFLLGSLKELLASTIGDPGASTIDDHWAIRSTGSRWGQTNIAWWYLQEQPEKIGLTVYILSPNDEQRRLAREAFESVGMDPRLEGSWIGWHALELFGSREEAEREFVRLSLVVNRMYPASPPPANPGAEDFDGVSSADSK